MIINDDKLSKDKARLLNPLVLAYVGDSVYEVFVRDYLIKNYEGYNAHKLHKSAIKFVKAEGQSKFILNYLEKLREDELDIFKRGRNTKSNTTPKNCSVVDYRIATGFEALIGYLHLIGDEDRIKELVFELIKFYNLEEKNG